eukprot:m.391982 g.391982  ORF g.391982 m.391982 type:complete len:1112 (-) comp28319_c1_seq6:2403-5738(-)
MAKKDAADAGTPSSTASSAAWGAITLLQAVAIAFLLNAHHNTPTQTHASVAPAEVHRRQAAVPSLSNITFDELAAEVVMLKRRLNALPQGPPGPRGARGYRGEAGTIGSRGSTGNAGTAGADGANGYCAIMTSSGEVTSPCPQLRDAANAAELGRVRAIVDSLARQIIVGEVAKEQRVRYEGGSGIALTRGYAGGSKAYHEASYTNVGFANLHNHANLRHTMGMGEIVAVLNGVQFASRHNDYSLQMADPTIRPGNNADYHKVKYIDTPDVPPEVLAHASVSDQAEEMRRWFHAWIDQDATCPSCRNLDRVRLENNETTFDPYPAGTNRPYQNYFKPVLCALEGAWIASETDFTQAFSSDRHFTDANTWRELYDKNRFLYQSGRKSVQENLPFLPLSIRGLLGVGTDDNATTPAFANWQYRIICTPIDGDVPLDRFKVKSDLAIQLGNPNGVLTPDQLTQARTARFDLNLRNQSSWVEGRHSVSFIDELMYMLPGKDGYGANHFDDSFGSNATKWDNASQVLNTARYTRYYSTGGNDAMGRSQQRRSFNDPTMWAAMTTMPRIQGVTSCTAENLQGLTAAECNSSTTKTQKWTWAIPIEIIYTTPLSKWNPYNLTYCNGLSTQAACAFTKQGSARARTGGLTAETAYNGTARDTWFVTPAEFFESNTVDTDAADTSGSVTGVLDQNGVLRRTRAAGHWIFFPPIAGFNRTIRQRFPIMPVHEHGRTTWKEVKALQDILIADGGSQSLAAQLSGVLQERQGVSLRLAYTAGVNNVGPHTHTIHITGDQLRDMDASSNGISVSTSLDNGHQHEVRVNRLRFTVRNNIPIYRYQLLQCDDPVSNAVRTCGNRTAYTDNRAGLRSAVGALSPWGFYTEADVNYRVTGTQTAPGTDGVWHDISGNNRHTVSLGKERSAFEGDHPAPYLYDFNKEQPGVMLTYNRGLIFPSGSVPTTFTIFARGKFIEGEEWNSQLRRIVQANATSDWYMGWDTNVGEAKFGSGVYVQNGWGNSTRTARYNYQTIVGRNQQTDALVMNGAPLPQRSSFTSGGTGGFTLALGAAGGYGSDALVTDLVVFDRLLSTAEVNMVNAYLQDPPARPQPCCWDLHQGVNVYST